jgi:hypothetical protein
VRQSYKGKKPTTTYSNSSRPSFGHNTLHTTYWTVTVKEIISRIGLDVREFSVSLFIR